MNKKTNSCFKLTSSLHANAPVIDRSGEVNRWSAMHWVNRLLVGILLSMLISCAPLPSKAPIGPVTPNFNFEPPARASSRSDMAIAVIKPLTNGSMFTQWPVLLTGPDAVNARTYLNDMIKAAKTDMEKIIVAKGFNTLGPFESVDEMTYSQKERASLIFVPTFESNIDLQSVGSRALGYRAISQEGTVLVRGTVILAFLEPLTKEKVWLKRFDLEPFSAPYAAVMRVAPVTPGEIIASGLLGRQVPTNQSTQLDAVVTTLNSFYGAAMSKMWEHLDTREVSGLKGEVQKLKKLKRF